MDVLDENGLSRVWDKAVAKVAASQANPVMTGSVSANRKEGTTVGDYSNTFGYNCTASGDYAFAEGYTTTASGDYSHSAGNNTTASGNFSNSWGDNTLAVGAYSHVEGTQTKAIGDYAHAEGYKGQAVGQGSHAEGADTLAVQQYAHAEGWGSHAVGQAAHAEGNATKAYNNNSHSEGFESEAGVSGGNNQAPHAEGYQTKSTGRGSHSEGYKTIASGDQSHAEGSETTASSSGSHAEGVSTTCSGSYSHTEGQGTVAASSYQHVHGKYNIADNNNTYATIVGNGSSITPSNAYTLDWSGNGIFAGKLTVGSNPVNNMDVATKGYVDSVSDTKVTQTPLDSLPSGNDIYEVLFSHSFGNTTETAGVNKTMGLTFSPRSRTLSTLTDQYVSSIHPSGFTVRETATSWRLEAECSDITLGGTNNTWDGTHTSLKDTIAAILARLS